MFNSYEFNYTLLNKMYKKELDHLLTNRLKSVKSIVKTNLKKDLSKKIEYNISITYI